MTGDSAHHVVIAGGGVAALETLLALRALAGEQPRITLLAPDSDFVLRASAVLEPFARGRARRVPIREITEEHGAHLVADALRSVDPEDHVAVMAGADLDYDTLVVALGTITEPACPGAIMFAGPAERDAVEAVLVEAERGEIQDLAFVVPPGASWPLPAYELALLTSVHLAERGGAMPRIKMVTPEERPLELFGKAASADLQARLDEHGIEVVTLSRARLAEDGELQLEGGGHVRADRVIGLPRLLGPAVEGLPHDDLGFIPVDEHGRVRGVADVYAAGDCTAFPLKQGGIAAQQADAVAQAIAAELGMPLEPEPFRPVLRGLLVTGGGPSYFRSYPGTDREPSTVAIDEPAHPRQGEGGGVAAHRPLWWPPSKVAGRHLGAWLSHPRSPGGRIEQIEDRPAPDRPDNAAAEEERAAALDLALMMADGEARYGDWHGALRALEAAQALTGMLPPEYEQKRELWQAELEGRPGARYLGS